MDAQLSAATNPAPASGPQVFTVLSVAAFLCLELAWLAVLVKLALLLV